MERLVRIASALQHHSKLGVDGETLAKIAGFDGEYRMDQLKRELGHLERQGWQIENIAPPGENAVYKMTTVDNRLRVRLSARQQAALRRAVLLANRDDLVTRLGLPGSSRPSDITAPQTTQAAVSGEVPAALSLVVDAVRGHCLLRFGYKGTARVVHPESVRNQNGVWYCRGVEDADLADAVVKTFVVGRMVDVEAGVPGSAQALTSVRHSGLHPMTWEIDPPVDVVLQTAPDFEPDVRRWLGEPVSSETVADGVNLTFRVTHRAALRARLNELGRRVRVLGPPEIRADILAGLAEAAKVGR
ncbi:hypothetical protein ASD81_05540 [Nocardioides sp. Root614]|nr:hypothetical protein ASD81_05540 [Nocardioides sp. Root614]KRA92082.1 hypothetical protein ASD84_05805 [Nocardioides sp. Root682]